MANSPKASADPIDARLVRTLADILTETGLTEIEVERDDLKIRVARHVTVTATVVPKRDASGWVSTACTRTVATIANAAPTAATASTAG